MEITQNVAVVLILFWFILGRGGKRSATPLWAGAERRRKFNSSAAASLWSRVLFSGNAARFPDGVAFWFADATNYLDL